jgi:hypothetical protein
VEITIQNNATSITVWLGPKVKNWSGNPYFESDTTSIFFGQTHVDNQKIKLFSMNERATNCVFMVTNQNLVIEILGLSEKRNTPDLILESTFKNMNGQQIRNFLSDFQEMRHLLSFQEGEKSKLRKIQNELGINNGGIIS